MPTIAMGQVSRRRADTNGSIVSVSRRPFLTNPGGPCFLEKNKPPSHLQQESPQQPISRFGISCCTSRCLDRRVSQSSASVRSTPVRCLPISNNADRVKPFFPFFFHLLFLF